jgi:hypothetical protein
MINLNVLENMKYEDYQALEERAFLDQKLQDKFIEKNAQDFELDMHMKGVDPDYIMDYEFDWIEKNTTRFLEFAIQEYNLKESEE